MRHLSINSLIVLSGTVINALLGLFFYILIARSVSPAEFGLVAVALSITVIVADLIDLGLNTAIIKELSRSDAKLNTLFTVKLLLACGVSIFGLLASPIISLVFMKSLNDSLIWFGFLGAGSTILFGFWNYRFLASRKFLHSSLLNITSNLLRVILLLLLMTLSLVNPENILMVFSFSLLAVLPIAQVTGGITLPRFYLSKSEIREVFKFSGYVDGSIAIGSLYSRLDNFLLATFSNATQTGLYTSVQRFFLTANQLPSSVGSVFSPDLSSGVKNRIAMSFKFFIICSPTFSLLLLIVFFQSDWIVPVILGQAYINAVSSAKIISLGSIFFVLSMPASSYLLYTEGKSKTIFNVTLVQTLIVVAGNVLLIPVFGATGAALSYSASTLAGFLVYNWIYLRKRQ